MLFVADSCETHYDAHFVDGLNNSLLMRRVRELFVILQERFSLGFVLWLDVYALDSQLQTRIRLISRFLSREELLHDLVYVLWEYFVELLGN